MKIKWSYYFDEIKSRKFYIFGFLLLIFITSLDQWIIIGSTVIKGQELSILPSNINLAIILQKIREWGLDYTECDNERCAANECRHGIAISNLIKLLETR